MKLTKIITLAAAAVIMIATASCKGATDSALNKTIDEINKQMENQTMQGMEKMYLSADDSYVIFNYVVDEDMMDMAQSKAAAEESKAQIRSSILNNPSQQTFIKLVKATDRGVKFSYRGNKTSDNNYDIVFESAEI